MKDLRHALRQARRLGCDVQLNKAGETVVRHPAIAKPLRLCTRRKDTPRSLLVFMRRVQEAIQ